MKAAKKHAFYPDARVEKVLKKIPRGHLSERVNELILKGLALEKHQDIAEAYQSFNNELLKSPAREYVKKAPTKFMSKAAFDPEDDEEEDFI